MALAIDPFVDVERRLSGRSPARALALGLAHVLEREVLLCGPRAACLAPQLQRRGAQIALAPLVWVALDCLVRQLFDVIVVDAETPHGLALVSALKQRVPMQGISDDILDSARARNGRAPVLVPPLDDETEYAVIIRPPELAFIERVDRVPLVDAILGIQERRPQ